MDNTLNSSFIQKMYYIICFELVCVFFDCFMQILLPLLRSRSQSRALALRSRVSLQGLDNNTVYFIESGQNV